MVLALYPTLYLPSPVSAYTLILRPDNPGDYTSIAWIWQIPALTGAHWDKVDEITADDASTYVYTLSDAQRKDAYRLEDTPSQIATINSVTVYFRFRRSWTSSGSSAYCQPFLRLYSNETAGTEQALNSNIWTNYSQTLARPGDGSWSWADINDLQVCIGLRDTGALASAQCTQVYVEVDYTPCPIWYADTDGDGYGDPDVTQQSCTQPSGYVSDNNDCDDNDAAINPTTVWYHDYDGDTYGDPNDSLTQCTQPSGYVADNNDCDDTNNAVYPGATEVCNGIDDNCDGNIDEGVMPTWYADSDGDTYGDPNITQQSCTQPSGFVADNNDCDDTNNAVYPGATEVCNGIDDNCDGNIDEGCGGDGGNISFETTAAAPATASACPLTLTVNMLGQITTAKMTSEGVLCQDCLAFDPPKQNSWEAKAGTKLTLVNNKVPQLIKVTPVVSSPPAAGAETIGSTYAINAYASLDSTTPSAINIYPLFSMSSAYDPNNLPRNTSQVTFAYYPNPNQGWRAMGSEGAIAEIGEVRGTLNYFVPDTLLAKLAETAPAKFEAGDLTISPARVLVNQQIIISLNVANTGGTSGDYTADLRVDGVVKSSDQVIIASGTSRTVTFTITEGTVGKHQIEVAGLSGAFTVTGPFKINWWPIGGIIAALILTLAIWILMRWRRFSGY